MRQMTYIAIITIIIMTTLKSAIWVLDHEMAIPLVLNLWADNRFLTDMSIDGETLAVAQASSSSQEDIK